MSAVEDELAEVLGSAEAAQRHIAFMREQVNIAQALWNVPAMPMDQRLSVLAGRTRMLAEMLRSGEVDKIEVNARRDILDLAALADILDPASDNGEKLVFARRRAGNPKAGMGRFERSMISLEARRLYQEMLEQGNSRHGLKKRISDVIGRQYGKKGSTIEKLWQVPGRKGRRGA